MSNQKLGGTNRRSRHLTRRFGFTLVEAIIAIAVFSILLLSIFGIAQQVRSIATLSFRKSAAAAIAEEQIELIRNMTFDQIGTDVTYPTGPLPSSQTLVRNGTTFIIKIGVAFVDDPADGVAPADTVPADYKRVDVQVCWDSGSCNKPVRLSTLVVPKTLEYANNAGALFIKVIDANGQPVNNATVQVTNASPAVNVISQTDVTGQVQLLDLPAATNSYHVTVNKSGYSTDSTLAVSVSNPHPTNPDTTVAVSQVTNVTLTIDRVSSLLVKALDQSTCSGLGAVTVRITGQRVVGTNPNVPAYDQTFTTDAGGQFLISNLPWDSYSMVINSAGNDIAGVTPPDNIQVNPSSSITSSIILTPHQAQTARIIVRDTGTHSPIANATVNLTNNSSYFASLVTDQGTIQQNNWVGGAGQSLFTDPTMFATISGGIDISSANQMTLGATDTPASVGENFQSATKEDSGNTTATWDTTLQRLTLPADQFVPANYAPSATAQSLKMNSADGVITSVTLTATASLNGQSIAYYAAADGTTFEAVTPGSNHTFVTTGSDLRWRAILSTTNVAVTPSISAINLSYHQLIRSVTDGTIVSSTFDNGGPTNYTTLSWEPTSQPPSAGSGAVRYQVATADPTVGSGQPVVDQTSDPSTTPLFTKNIGDAANTTLLAQSFTAGTTDTIDSIDLKIAQHGTPTTAVTVFVYSDVSGAPGVNLSGSGQDLTITVPSDSSSTWQNGWNTQSFAPHTALVAGTKYWLVVQVNGSNSSKYWTVVRSNTAATYANGNLLVGSAIGSLTAVCGTGCDLAFQIRRSGQTVTANTPTVFVGPDGTSNTYFSTSGSSLPSSLSNKRYLRYKVYLHTDDALVTPTISRISIIKNNACTPPGQVLFSPLPGSGSYTASVNVSGYQPASVPMSVTGNANQYIDLTPSP